MTVPYAHDDLGEENYGTGDAPAAPDRRIDAQEAHPPFYGLGDEPQPYPL